MSVARERADVNIKTLRIPPDLCFGTATEFVKLLTQILTGELDISAGNEFTIVGHQPPGEDEKNKLWIRLSINGSFIGFYFFQDGSWVQVFNRRNDEVIWMHGDSRRIPDGFELIDVGTGQIATDVKAHIINFYLQNTAVTGSTVFKYFAVRYNGF